VKIPRSVEEAETQLGILGALIHSREWERAAIVAAFVEVGSQGVGKVSSDLSPAEFAAKGIAGLRSKNTVQRYAEAWLSERPRPKPGEEIDLTGLPDWPPNLTVGAPGGMTPERRDALMAAGVEAGMAKGSKVVDIAANPRSLAAAIMADPSTAAVALRALQDRAAAAPSAPESADHKAAMARLGEMKDGSDRFVKPILDAVIALEGAQRDWDEFWPGLTAHGKDAVVRALHEAQVITLTLTGLIEMEESL